MTERARIAVVGHVEHVTLGRVAALPRPGEIVHLDDVVTFAGGGGGMAFFQLAKSPAELHVFTAVGDDEAGAFVEARLRETGAHVHLVRRPEPHTRVTVLVTPDHERTILVQGQPQQPRAGDDLPWDLLDGCDAAYFIGRDPDTLRRTRAAKLLVVAARRRPVLIASGARADVVVGSVADPLEAGRRADLPIPPDAFVLTDGPRGGRIESAAGALSFPAPPTPPIAGTSYGAGDSFAAALTWYLSQGAPVLDACRAAGPHGAAVLTGPDPVKAQRPLG